MKTSQPIQRVKYSMWWLVNLVIWCGINTWTLSGAAPPGAATRDAPTIARDPTNVLCGPECLYQAAIALGDSQVSLGHVTELCETDLDRGTSMAGLKKAAEKMGMKAEVVETSMRGMLRDPRIKIALLQRPYTNESSVWHFVVIERTDANGVSVLDGSARTYLSSPLFQSQWRGVYVAVSAKNDELRPGGWEWRFGVWSMLLSGMAGASVVVLAMSVVRGKRQRVNRTHSR